MLPKQLNESLQAFRASSTSDSRYAITSSCRARTLEDRRGTQAVSEQIAFLEDLLAHPKKILALIQTDLKEIAEKYGDDRRTRIASDAKEELTEEDLVQMKPC